MSADSWLDWMIVTLIIAIILVIILEWALERFTR